MSNKNKYFRIYFFSTILLTFLILSQPRLINSISDYFIRSIVDVNYIKTCILCFIISVICLINSKIYAAIINKLSFSPIRNTIVTIILLTIILSNAATSMIEPSLKCKQTNFSVITKKSKAETLFNIEKILILNKFDIQSKLLIDSAYTYVTSIKVDSTVEVLEEQSKIKKMKKVKKLIFEQLLSVGFQIRFSNDGTLYFQSEICIPEFNKNIAAQEICSRLILSKLLKNLENVLKK